MWLSSGAFNQSSASSARRRVRLIALQVFPSLKSDAISLVESILQKQVSRAEAGGGGKEDVSATVDGVCQAGVAAGSLERENFSWPDSARTCCLNLRHKTLACHYTTAILVMFQERSSAW